MKLLLLPCILATVAFANPPVERQLAPTVRIKDGTVIGTSLRGVDSFKGIPYAEPPVKNRRLKPPQKLQRGFGTFRSNPSPNSCPQFIANIPTGILPPAAAGLVESLPIFQASTNSSEDCLTINVQRPSTATKTSKLPVLFWIYGGGFEFGSTQTYDGSSFISKSVELGKDIVYVAVNYRVGGFGFLAGDDLTKEGSTNLGLLDQRLGLEWVQQNIEAFGGDPDKVTIWGESAGSISVLDHLIINGGDHLSTTSGRPLFRGAIMNSGSMVPAVQSNSKKAQGVYEAVLAAAGCSKATDRLSCLRGLSYQKYLSAVNSLPSLFSYHAISIAYLPRPNPTTNFFRVSPELAVRAGKLAKVPIIIGDQEDEGTVFSLTQSNVTTTQKMINYFLAIFPLASRTDITKVIQAYPDDPSAGSPFRTGPLNNLYPQYKRIAAFQGDLIFTLGRRILLEAVSSYVPTWSYLSSYFYGTPAIGTAHATDLLALYFGTASPIPQESIRQYYIAFVNGLDPNSIPTKAPLIHWPRWTSKGRSLLHFQTLSNKLLKDNFRQQQYDALKSTYDHLRL